MNFDVQDYPSHKSSGIHWLGNIPTHWDVGRLKSYTENAVDQVKVRQPNDIYIALEHVESWTGKLLEPELKVVFDSQVKRFRAGDVLFGKLRPYLAKVARPNVPGVCVGEFFVLRPSNGKLSAAYLEHVIRSKPFIDAVDASAYGAKMPRANWNFIGNLMFPLPPFAEQTAIVRYLDRADDRIRRATRTKERLIELLTEQRQAIIHRAVTRGLDPNVPLKDSSVEWLGDVPEHWESTAVKRHYDVQLGKMLQPSPSSPNDVEVPYLKAQHVHWNHIRIEDAPSMWANPNEVEQFGIRKGDLLIVEGGAGATNSALLEDTPEGYIIQNALHRVRPRAQARNDFLLFIMMDVASSGWFEAINNKATIPHFTKEKLDSLAIAIPSVSEQTDIVRHLEKATADIDDTIDNTQRQIDLLREYHTRLIADVVTGQLDVRDTS